MSEGIKTALNPNKIIKLYRTGNNTKTWRSTISDIIGGVSSENDASSNITASPDKQMFTFGEDKSTDVQDNIDLLMTNDPEKFKNNVGTATPVRQFFDKLNGGTGNSYIDGAIKAVKIVSKAADIFRAADNTMNGAETETSLQFTPWMADIKSWNGQYNSLTFTYNFSFAMGQYGLWDAKEEVVKPAFNLIAPVFPQYINALYSRGPIPNILNLATNLIGNLKEFADNEEEGEAADDGWLSRIGRKLDNLLLSTYGNFVWDIEFGTMIHIKRCMITNGTAEFSKETDTNGFPIGATVTLTFDSSMPLALSADSDSHMAARFGK